MKKEQVLSDSPKQPAPSPCAHAVTSIAMAESWNKGMVQNCLCREKEDQAMSKFVEWDYVKHREVVCPQKLSI